MHTEFAVFISPFLVLYFRTSGFILFSRTFDCIFEFYKPYSESSQSIFTRYVIPRTLLGNVSHLGKTMW